MLSQAAKARYVKLLADVLTVFGSDLPASKAATAAKLKPKYSRARAQEVENHLKDFYDDLCVETGLISIHLASLDVDLQYYDDLWLVMEPLLPELELLLPSRFRTSRQVRNMP